MAELILSSRGPHKGPGAESYFDFEPGNTAMLETIETLLARRSGNITQQEEQLAEVCAKSVEDGASIVRRAMFFGWVEILQNLSRRTIGSNYQNRMRSRRQCGKSGDGRSLPGKRRRFSFA